MPPMDAYALRADLIDEMHSNALWTMLTDNYFDSTTGRSRLKEFHPEGMRYGPLASNSPDQRVLDVKPIVNPAMVEMYPSASAFRRRLARTAEMAHTYYVSPEMCVLVTAAAEEMPEDERVFPSDFPVEHGFMLIPHGIVQIDIRGSACVTSAIMWNILGGRINLTYLADKTHPLDRLSTELGLRDAAEEEGRTQAEADKLWRDLPRLTPWHDMYVDMTDPLPKALSLGMVIPPEHSRALRVIQEGNSVSIAWEQGYEMDDLMSQIAADPSSGLVVEPVFRWLLACLRLMQQPLTSVETVGVPTNLRRQHKDKTRMKNSAVTVIEYRRREYEGDHEDSGRTFSHRFFRRGHWRRQPFKNPDGEWDRKRIWIHPTLVGDPSLPLKLRDHVNALLR